MRQLTHALIGAAVVVPLALTLPPLPAVGCLWWGMIGADVPDWLDLRSRAGKLVRLRHRGASHGIPVLVLATVTIAVVLLALRDVGYWQYEAEDTRVPVMAFALGMASHLVSDSLTRAGIQPWLPFSRRKLHLLPRPLRSRYDGYLDYVTRIAAVLILVGGAVLYGWNLTI